MLLIFSIIIIIFLLMVDFIILINRYKKIYSQFPLQIKTFDGYNQPYHPAVLYKDNQWNKFKYWMAVTPYPMNAQPYRDRWECPCIYHSNNGTDWYISSSLAYPLDDLNGNEIMNKDFFSDPHLLLKDNLMECWYRLTHRYRENMDTYILRKTSADGINWTEREVLIDPNDKDILHNLGDMVRSPAIIWQNEYRMWYVDNKKNIGQRNICFSSSSNGFKWKQRIICQLKGKEINPWHIDVSYIDNVYYLIIYDLDSLSLWKSEDSTHFDFIKTILKPSLVYGSFWSDGLYRSVLVKNEKSYLLYFSAYDEEKRYIGLMKGDDPSTLKVISASNGKSQKHNWIRIYLTNRKRTLSNIKRSILHNYS